MDATGSDSVVTEINDHLEPNMRDTDKGNTPPLTNDNNKNCSCCTKRRLTKVDSNQKNTKKARVEPSSSRRDVRGVHFGCLIKMMKKHLCFVSHVNRWIVCVLKDVIKRECMTSSLCK